MEKRKKIQHGFMVLLACFLIQAIVFGVASNIHPQFLGYIVDDGGYSLGAISGMFMVGTIVSAIFSPTIGKLFTKIPYKVMYLAGCLISAGGVFLLGIASNVGMFYIGYSLAQIGAAIVSSIGLPMLLSAWFDEEVKGKALGIAFAGGGIGNVFLQQLAKYWIVNFGYGRAYVNFAILSAIFGAVVILLLVRAPKDASEMIKGKKAECSEVEEVKEKWGYSFAELKGMKAYWIYAAAFVFIGIYVSVLASQYSAYLKSIGFDAGTLANVASTFAFFSVIGNLSGGFLYDKLGVTKTTIIGFTLALIACVSLLFAEQMPQLAYLYGVTKGLSVFAYMLAPSMLASALFGPKEFGPVFSITNIFFALGFAFGSVGFGLLVGALGYQVSWIVILASIVIGYLLLLTAIKSFLKLNKENFGR